MRRLSLAGLGVSMLLMAVPVLAHHAFAAEFDASQPVALKGTLTKMEWTNPHGWIFVDVKGADGKVVNWACETGGANALYRRGWRKEDLVPGIVIVVDGFQARNNSPTMNATAITFKDGRKLFAGSSSQNNATSGK